MNITKNILLFVAIPSLAISAVAKDYSLAFEDTSSGINWSGIVDTTEDTLTINDWGASGSAFYPEPSYLPMKFNAVSGAFGNYDIPDNWDGSINNWGFISEFVWSEYNWTNANVKDGEDVAFFAGDNPPPVAVGISLQHTPSSAQSDGDQFIFTPEHFARTYKNEFSLADVVNDGGTPKSPTSFAVKAVPEPSSALLLLVGAAGGLSRRKR